MDLLVVSQDCQGSVSWVLEFLNTLHASIVKVVSFLCVPLVVVLDCEGVIGIHFLLHVISYPCQLKHFLEALQSIGTAKELVNDAHFSEDLTRLLHVSLLVVNILQLGKSFNGLSPFKPIALWVRLLVDPVLSFKLADVLHHWELPSPSWDLPQLFN